MFMLSKMKWILLKAEHHLNKENNRYKSSSMNIKYDTHTVDIKLQILLLAVSHLVKVTPKPEVRSLITKRPDALES